MDRKRLLAQDDEPYGGNYRPLTYLACPYTHPDPAVRQARFEASNRAAAKLLRSGDIVYSPISHSHPIALQATLPTDWAFWERFDRAYIFLSNKIVVLTLDGWRESRGVTAEINLAKSIGLPVQYINDV